VLVESIGAGALDGVAGGWLLWLLGHELASVGVLFAALRSARVLAAEVRAAGFDGESVRFADAAGFAGAAGVAAVGVG